MSKYNKLQNLNEPEPSKEETQTPISKLCCLPILMEGKGLYKSGLKNFLSIEELLPHSQRLQIYQMLYMEKLLEELREYDLPNDEVKTDPIDIMSKMDKTGKTAKQMKYRQSGDISLLAPLFAAKNPMLAMLLPMLSQKQSANDADMLSALAPMMLNSGANPLSSIFNM